MQVSANSLALCCRSHLFDFVLCVGKGAVLLFKSRARNVRCPDHYHEEDAKRPIERVLLESDANGEGDKGEQPQKEPSSPPRAQFPNHGRRIDGDDRPVAL